MQARDLLVEQLRQHVHAERVLGQPRVQLELREHLVGERGAHDEARVARGVAEVHEAALAEHEDAAAGRQAPLVHLRLDLDLLGPGQRLEAGHVDLVVEVPDVGDDREVLERLQLLDRDDVLVAGRRDEDVDVADDVVEPRDLVAVHGRLQRVDRVDLADDDARALPAQSIRRALAHVAVAADEDGLAAHEHVGGAVEPVGQRVSDAVLVVELALRHRVVDVDGREEQFSVAVQLVEAVHARRGLFRHAQDALADDRPALRVALQRLAQRLEHDAPLVAVALDRVGNRARGLELGALVHEHRGVAAIVEDEGGALRHAVLVSTEAENLLRRPPVLVERLALPSEDGGALGLLGGSGRADDDGGGGFVLRREDVAAGPAHVGPEGAQRLDEHRGLHGHVQRAGDAGALQRLVRPELVAQAHEARHLVLSEADLVPAGLGEVQVGDLVVEPVAGVDGEGGRKRGRVDAHTRHSRRLRPGAPPGMRGVTRRAARGLSGVRGRRG